MQIRFQYKNFAIYFEIFCNNFYIFPNDIVLYREKYIADVKNNKDALLKILINFSYSYFISINLIFSSWLFPYFSINVVIN